MNILLNIQHKLKGDRMIWFILFILSACSLLAVYSAAGSMAYRMGSSTEFYLGKQFAVIVLSFVAAYVVHHMHYTVFNRLAPYFLLIAIFLLLLTMVVGVEVNDAKRWMRVPVIGLTFQPSDIARLALIIFVAKVVAERQNAEVESKEIWLFVILPIVIVCALIAPSDLSTAAMLFATCFGLLFIGRIRWKILVSIIGSAILIFLMIIVLGTLFEEANVRSDTWVTRVQSFVTGGGDQYQIEQAKIAIAEGGLTGVGPGNSSQRNFLPYAYADFIYAIICEEYGLVGGIAIVLVYLYLLSRCIRVVTRTPKTFAALLAFGLALNMVIQALLNIAVSVNLVPVTGLTLPMVSMGGTSTLFTAISFGIILSVSHFTEEHRKAKAREQQMEEEGDHLDIEPDMQQLSDERTD